MLIHRRTSLKEGARRAVKKRAAADVRDGFDDESAGPEHMSQQVGYDEGLQRPAERLTRNRARNAVASSSVGQQTPGTAAGKSETKRLIIEKIKQSDAGTGTRSSPRLARQ